MNTRHIVKQGFTLIELLVVIAIIGLLASVVLAALSQARAASRDAARQSDMKQVQNALELYRTANGVYPAEGTTFLESVTGLAPQYIGSLPVDPTGASSRRYRYGRSDGAAYGNGANGYTLAGYPESNGTTLCVYERFGPQEHFGTYADCPQ